MANIRETSTSRLVQNSGNIRARLKARNMYNIGTQYPIQTDSVANRVLDSVNALAQIVTPYSGYDLRNTVFGRAIEDRTPLTEFGLVMLGKHFAMNAAKRAANQVIPIIKPSNLLPWRDGKLITSREDLSITVDSTTGGFQRFLERTIHFYPNSANPFSNRPTNRDYLENTGQAQLDFLYSKLNNNIYVSSEIHNFDDENIKPRTGISERWLNRGGNIRYFNMLSNPRFIPFSTNQNDWEEQASLVYNSSYYINETDYPEYAPDFEFISRNFGVSDKTERASTLYLSTSENSDDEILNAWVDSNDGFRNDKIENKIVWGLNGVTNEVRQNLGDLRPGISQDIIDSGVGTNDLARDFNVRSGLLEYTRNLINSTGGHIGDITRKGFKRNGEIVGFNGSGLWQAPSTALERHRGKKGIRQHSVLDQYGTFAKAIRFDGNEVYGGNPNSVIYKSVLPKIHPIIDAETGRVDARNLMFSIENLAVEVIDDETNDRFGTINDEFGTKIPKSEVGQFNGRVMWFPPYNLEFTESHAANFESTVMVGRNEPMYNYLHSERAGTIRFSLIIDYPPQLKNYKGFDKHKKIAEFFAFGGEVEQPNIPDIDRLREKEGDYEDRINELETPPKFIELDIQGNEIRVSFPNDWPVVGDENSTTVFQEMFEKAYEINKKVPVIQSLEFSQYGLNEDIFYPKGVLKSVSATESWFFDEPTASQLDQYSYDPRNPDEFDTTDNLNTFENTLVTELDKYLLDVFTNEDNRKLIRIKVDAGASKLYFDSEQESEYNFRLGQRRANATKNFINARLRTLFGKDAEGLGIEFNLRGDDGSGSVGSRQASEENASRDRINARETKEERFALISFERTEYTPEPEEVTLTPEEQKELEQLKRDLDEIRKLINQAKKAYNRNIFRKKTAGDEDGLNDAGRISGFGNVAQNYYAPVFHSQTPEDFHRRLTFLHQCMRQGRANRYEVEIDDTGTPRARNSVFGRQPICVLRIADFFHTKIVIENLTIDYDEAPWDTNPEGFGMQPMIAHITLNIKILGGQSLKAPIDALQNAVSFNYYANSTFDSDYDNIYRTASYVSALEEANRLGIDDLRDKEGNLKSYEQVQKLIENKLKANANTE